MRGGGGGGEDSDDEAASSMMMRVMTNGCTCFLYDWGGVDGVGVSCGGGGCVWNQY